MSHDGLSIPSTSILTTGAKITDSLIGYLTQAARPIILIYCHCCSKKVILCSFFTHLDYSDDY